MSEAFVTLLHPSKKSKSNNVEKKNLPVHPHTQDIDLSSDQAKPF